MKFNVDQQSIACLTAYLDLSDLDNGASTENLIERPDDQSTSVQKHFHKNWETPIMQNDDTNKYKHAIFITGNGFDTAHNIPSQYSEFKGFLKEKLCGRQNIISSKDNLSEIIMKILNYIGKKHIESESKPCWNDSDYLGIAFEIVEKAYHLDQTKKMDDKERWADFENRLNLKEFFKYLIDVIEGSNLTINDTSCEESVELGCSSSISAKKSVRCFYQIFDSAMQELPKYFAQWIRTEVASPERMATIQKKKNLDNIIMGLCKEEGLLATFNYTNVLEEIYEVGKRNKQCTVYHIHGNAKEDNDRLVIGFGETALLDANYCEWLKMEKRTDEDNTALKNHIEEQYEKGEWIKWGNFSLPTFLKNIKDGTENIFKNATSLKQKNDQEQLKRLYDSDNLFSCGMILNSTLRKPSERIIAENELFKDDRLKTVKNMYLYGWSVQEPDYPYIMKIMAATKEMSLTVYLTDYVYQNQSELEAIKKRISICAHKVGKKVEFRNMNDE